MEVGTPTHFRVQTRGAGKAPLDVRFVGSGPGPAVTDFEVIDNHDYSYTVKYTPLQQVCAGDTLTHGNIPWRYLNQSGHPNPWGDPNMGSSPAQEGPPLTPHSLGPPRASTHTAQCIGAPS